MGGSPDPRSTSQRATTYSANGWSGDGQRRAHSPIAGSCRGPDDRRARRGRRAYRRRRRPPNAVRPARAHLDAHPDRAPRPRRAQRRLGRGGTRARHREPVLGADRARRELRDVPAALVALGDAHAAGRTAGHLARPAEDPVHRVVREQRRAGEARRPVPLVSREAQVRHLALADRGRRRRRAAARSHGRVRAAHRRWLRRLRAHGPAGPHDRVRHRDGARRAPRRGLCRDLLRRAEARALLPGRGAPHRAPLPRGRAPLVPGAPQRGGPHRRHLVARGAAPVLRAHLARPRRGRARVRRRVRGRGRRAPHDRAAHTGGFRFRGDRDGLRAHRGLRPRAARRHCRCRRRSGGDRLVGDHHRRHRVLVLAQRAPLRDVRAAWLLLAAVSVPLALVAVGRWLWALAQHAPVLYGEGAVANAALLARSGVEYGPYPADPIFVAANYPPLYFHLVALGDPFVTGRVLSIAATLFVAGAIAYRARGGGRLFADALAASWLACAPVAIWGAAVKPDLVALALIVGAVMALDARRAAVAGALAALAIWAKPTEGLPALALLLYLVATDRPRAARFTGAGIVALAIAAALTHLPDAAMLEHVVTWNALDWHADQAFLLAVLGALVAGASLVALAVIRPRDAVGAYAIGAIGVVALGGRDGATINYLLDLLTAAWLALAAASQARPSRVLPVAIVAQTLIAIALLDPL